MSGQIAIFFNGLGLFDIGLDESNNHIVMTEDLRTCIALSLLTDRRASEGQLPAGKDRGGWWGDTYAEQDNDALGSWLWTLRGAPRTDDTLRLADAYARSALAWMIRDGIVDSISVEKEFAAPGLRLRISLTRGQQQIWSDWWTVTL